MKNAVVAISLGAMFASVSSARETVDHPAYLSAASLFNMCAADGSDPDQNAKIQACAAFVMGVNDAILDVYSSRGKPMPYCMPVRETPRNLIAKMRAALEANRSAKDKPAATLVREQLEASFPC